MLYMIIFLSTASLPLYCGIETVNLDSEHIVLFMRSFMRFWECRGCGYDIVSINRNLIIWNYWNGIIRNLLDGYWRRFWNIGDNALISIFEYANNNSQFIVFGQI